MAKRAAQPIRAGQLDGAEIRIEKICNRQLFEFARIENSGTVAQPMGGWVLASLRGACFYGFLDDLILLPGEHVTIRSGQEANSLSAGGLFWTVDQVWNNRGDVAVLFDVDGWEVDRYAYPNRRFLGRKSQRIKRLVRDGDTWRIVDEVFIQGEATVRMRATAPTHKKENLL